jgi:hypothetical protein
MNFRTLVLLALPALYFGCGKQDPPAPAPASAKPGTPRSLSPMSFKPWTPPTTMPEPREVLKGEEWTQRWAALKAKATLEQFEGTSEPPYSLRIISVVTGLQGARAGIEVGDRLVRFEGKPVRGIHAFEVLREDLPGRLELWSPSRGPYSVDVKRGRIGVSYVPHWDARVAYVQSKERDPKWDEFMVGAASRWWEDSDLAETALFHARKAGYDGWFLPALMTRLAFAQARGLESMNYGWFARDRIPEDQKQYIYEAFITAAAVSGQLDWVRKMNKEWAQYCVLRDGWDADLFQRLPKRLSEEELREPSPCTVAASGRFPTVAAQPMEINSKKMAGFLKSSGRAPFDLTPPGEFGFAFGPGGRNVDFLMEFELQPFEPRLEGSYPAGSFSLVAISQGIEETIVEVIVRPDSEPEIRGEGVLETTYHGKGMFQKGKKNRVEVAARGKQCELRFNDRCLYLGTLEDSPDRVLHLSGHLWNVRGAVTLVEATALDAPKEAEAAPTASAPASASSSALKVPAKPADPQAAWYHQAFVDGYLTHGRRNPAWDQAAVDALAAFAPFFQENSHIGGLGDILQFADAAMAAGCDDPLLTYAHGMAHWWADLDEVRWGRRIRRGAEWMRTSKLSPALRCFILAHASSVGGRAVSEDAKNRRAQLAIGAMGLLREALEEDGVPGLVLLEAMTHIWRNHPESWRDGECGYQKIALEAEGAKKNRAAFLAFKGEFFITHAWNARGGDWASKVSDEGWKLFHHRLGVAAEALEESWKADPRNPGTPARMLKVALGHEATRNNLQTWIKRSLEASPNNREAINNLIWFLAPRWFGSNEDLLRTGRQYFEQARKDHLDPAMALVLIHAHETIVMPGSFSEENSGDAAVYAEEYWKSDPVWKDISRVFEWILQEQPDSAYYRSLYASWACKAGRWTVAREQFEKLGDRVLPGPFGSAVTQAIQKAKALRKG